MYIEGPINQIIVPLQVLKTNVAFKEINNRINFSFDRDRPFLLGSDAQMTVDPFVQVKLSLSWRFAIDPELINTAASLRWKGLNTHISTERHISTPQTSVLRHH